MGNDSLLKIFGEIFKENKEVLLYIRVYRKIFLEKMEKNILYSKLRKKIFWKFLGKIFAL